MLWLTTGFSFIVWEMAKFIKPFEGYNKQEFYEAVVQRGERPPLDPRWNKAFSDLLEASWHPTPSERPVRRTVHEGCIFCFVSLPFCG